MECLRTFDLDKMAKLFLPCSFLLCTTLNHGKTQATTKQELWKVVRGRLAGLGAQDRMNNSAAGCLMSPHLKKKAALVPCFLILNLAADSHQRKLILPYDRMGIPIRPWQRGSIGSLINDKQLGECSLLPCWTCSFPLLPRDTGVAKWKWNESAPSLSLYPYNKWPGL